MQSSCPMWSTTCRRNPDAPELGKREQDASFVFVDISGYTARSEKMAADTLSHLVERYFSAFLDEKFMQMAERSAAAPAIAC